MSLALALTLAASVAQPSCSWDRPGANRYTGKTGAAIDRYTDIPERVRLTLKKRLAEGQYDDSVLITRDAIAGRNAYDPAIRDMHFGAASVCATVTRSKWSEQRSEPGAVYCVKEHCILVPKICGNVSRISRIEGKAKSSAGEAAPPQARAGKPAGPSIPFDARRLLDGDTDGAAPGMADPELLGQSDEEAMREAGERVRKALSGLGQLNALPEAQPLAYADPLDEIDLDAIDRHNHLFGIYGRHPLSPFGDPQDDELFIPAPVPEADTWAMLLAGLGVLGLIGRRRRRPA